MSWKNVGGINNNEKNRYIRASNFHVDSAVATQSIGKKNTTAYVEGDLFFQDGVKLYSTRNEIDQNGLYAHYPFNSIISSDSPDSEYIFYNESKNLNINSSDSHLKETKSSTIGGALYSFAENSPKIYVDLSYGNTLHLAPKSSLLYTDVSFNPSDQINNEVLADEFKAMTMNCWIFVDTPTAETPDTGFLLFGLDTENLENTYTEAVGRDRIDGQIDHLTPSFYFFCPGYGHNSPQIYWTEDVSNAMLTGGSRASAKSQTPLVYNSWNMITVIVRNREVEIYRNGTLTDTLPVSGRMPNNKYKMIINGNRFYDISTQSWVTTNYTSEHDVKIIDYKVFNYACHPEYIKLLYKHYSDLTGIRADSNRSQIHSKSSFNYYIDPSFSLLNSTLFVQGDILSIGKHEVFNKQTIYGPSEILNDSYISGSLGVGINNPDEKIHIRGNVKASGNLYLGFEDISVNGIYFKGYTGDVNPFYKHTAIEEKYYIDIADGSMNYPYTNQSSNTELLIFKGNEIDENKQDPKSISIEDSITDASWNNTQGDRIRIKAPNILFDTYNISNSNIGNNNNRYEETHGMIFDQSGNLGINTLYAKQRLDVRGKINLQTDDRYDISSNIYISNTSDPDPLNKGYQNTALGGAIFTKMGFDSSVNTAIGYESQRDLESGYENTTLGHSTLRQNIIGYKNVAVGNNSLQTYTGNFGTSVGYGSQQNNTTGVNTSIGYLTLQNNVGSDNIAIGKHTMKNGTQSENIGIGDYALNGNDTSGNVAIGNYSQSTGTGNTNFNNTSTGYKALQNIDSSNNVAIGFKSMNNSTVSDSNVAVGSMSLQENAIGSHNVALGFQSMMSSTSSNNVDANIAIGSHSLQNTNISEQVAIGHESQKFATTASGNVSLGTRSLKNNTLGNHNVAVGFESQTAFTGEPDSHNTSIGYKTLFQNASGKYNTAIGHESLQNTKSSNDNTSVGHDSLHENIAALNNAFGAKSLYNNSNGTNNLAFGSYALYNEVSGSENIAIGNNSSLTNTESNNLSIGNNSQFNNNIGYQNISLGNNSMYTAAASYNSLAIGFKSQENAQDASSNISIGNYSLYKNSTDQNDNIAIGYKSMKDKRLGQKNIAIGSYSYSNTIEKPNHDGDSNIAIGYETMRDTSCNISIAIGNNALIQSIGDRNIAIGEESQHSTISGEHNISIGYESLYSNDSGSKNTGLGYMIQRSNTTGSENTSLGYKALTENTVGTLNTAIGYESMRDASGPYLINNTAIGINTLKTITASTTANGQYNTAIGSNSMRDASGGNLNIAIGNETLNNNISGSKNVAVGNQSLYNNSSGDENVGVGHETLFNNLSGKENTAIGKLALHENISGSQNTAIGVQSLYYVTSGVHNVGIGYQSQYLSNSIYNTSVGDSTLSSIASSIHSSHNSAFGFNSLRNLKIGGNNIAMGYNSMTDCTDGSFNIGIGHSALKTKSTSTNAGYSNIAIGNKTMYDISGGGNSNIAIGTETMYNSIDGSNNMALGMQSMYNSKGGTLNVAIGHKTMYDISGGTSNIAIGQESMYNSREGSNNIAFGIQSRYDSTHGNKNMAIGMQSMYSSIGGTSNIAIGEETMYNSTDGSNNIAFGLRSMYNSVDGSNNMALGMHSMYSSEGGNSNVGIGYKNMYDISGGTSNIAFGEETAYYLKEGEYNIALGYQSLYGNTGGSGNLNSKYNVAIGYQTMKNITSAEYNIALGHQSLFTNTTGKNNISIGENALYENEAGDHNIALGYKTLHENEAGNYNIALGYHALFENTSSKKIAIGSYSQEKGTTGEFNISIGEYALNQNTKGDYNTAIGYESQKKTFNDNDNKPSYNSSFGANSMTNNTSGENNVAIGSGTMYSNYTNRENVALGNDSLRMSVLSGDQTVNHVAIQNVSIGHAAMQHHRWGDSNIAMGYQSLMSNTTGGGTGTGDTNTISDNVSIGAKSMHDNEAGSSKNVSIGTNALTKGINKFNVAIGYESLYRNTVSQVNTASQNVAIGAYTLTNSTDAINNIAIGHQSLQSNLIGDYNIALGYQALNKNESAQDNIAIGAYTLNNSTDGDNNIAIGRNALQTHVIGDENIAIGFGSAHQHRIGSQNVYIGSKSANSDTDASQNTVVGYNSLNTNVLGQGNATLGYKSGNNCKGDYNIIIGYEADAHEDISNSIVIGYQASVAANGTAGTKANRNIAIGTNSRVEFATDSGGNIVGEDISNSIAFGNYSSVTATEGTAIGYNSSVTKERSTAIGVDANSNTYENTITIGETIPYKWLKHDHETKIGDDKYYNSASTRTFDDTVKVCIGTQSYKDTFGSDYKFRVDGSANITGNLKVDGNLIFTGDTIETIDHQVVRMSEQLDISNTGFSPALKITQYGSGANPNDFNFKEGSIIEVYDGDEEFDDISNVTVFHIKNGGNAFFRNNVDISRNMIIYNETSGKNQDPNEPDPSYNHFTIGARPGNYTNHNTAMRNTRDFQDSEEVNGQIQNQYPIRPITYLPPTGVTNKNYDFAGSRSGNSGTSDTKGQYSLEVSGNVFIHDYMKIETGRPFENSLDVHTTDGIQLPCGTIAERPGNYYYHANNPDPNINESVYPKVNPASDASTQRFQVNNFTGNSSDGSIRYNTDTSQCEVYSGGNMWTGLGGYKTEQPPYLFKYDLGQSQTTSIGDVPIKHNGRNLSIEKTAFYGKTAWRQLDTIYYDSFSGLPYPLYHYTVVDISTNSGWQLFKVLNGNVDENGNETTPDITYNFNGRLATNQFTTKTLAELPSYPDKPTIEASDTSTVMTNDSYIDQQTGTTSSIDVSFNQNGYFNIDPDLSFNVRVYALNKSRKKTNMIYLNNIFLLRVAYPGVVSFAFANSGVLIDAQTYYPFQEYSQYGVKMNLSFERANINNVGSTNDNATQVTSNVTIFDPNSTSYPSITYYNVRMYATDSKCMFNLDQSLGTGFRNTSITSMGNNMQDGTIVESYGSNGSPKTYQIVNEFGDLEQKNVQFQHTLLPGTKYTIALTAKNNRNPYFSHDKQAEWDPATVDMENQTTTPFQPSPVTIGGEFPASFTEMPYYTNVDGYLPPSGTENPLYVKYISKDDLNPIDLSNITFGGHRTVVVFDPTNAANNYKYIPYYNANSDVGWGTGRYFDVSGEENFYVNFNRQGTNCRGVSKLVSANLYINRAGTSLAHQRFKYYNSGDLNFIKISGTFTHAGGQSAVSESTPYSMQFENNVLAFTTNTNEAASADINKGFVQTSNFKITPSTVISVGSSTNMTPHRDIYSLSYDISAGEVTRDAANNAAYLDPSNNILQRTSVSPYDFYVDSYNSPPTKSTTSATITVDNANLLYCMGVPSSKLVSLNVDYTVSNYADQFLPAVETFDDSGTIKTLISKIAINSIGVNSQRFGSQQTYHTDDIKNFIGIDENYTTKYGDATATAAWPNIYLINNNDSVFYDTSTTDLTYQIIAYHLTNNIISTYDTVSLTSNEQTDLSNANTDKFTPTDPIWIDRKSFVKDSNGVISTLNPEVLNTYRPNIGSTVSGDWNNANMHISGLSYIDLDPTLTTFSLHDKQLSYFDGKFGTPTHVVSYSVNPYNPSGAPVNLNGRTQQFTHTNDTDSTSDAVNLDGPHNLKYVIFKIPASQHITDTGLVDISNLLINGENLDHYISADGVWPTTTLSGVFIWIAQEYNTETYYGSVNKLYDPIETNWYLNSDNKDDIVNAYGSDAAARTIDNPHHIRINTDDMNEMYLIVGLNIATNVYVNFPI